jgi:hypothetical protein
MGEADRKPLHFIGSSKKDLREMPEEVQDVFGSALLDAQYGDHPEGARPFGLDRHAPAGQGADPHAIVRGRRALPANV